MSTCFTNYAAYYDLIYRDKPYEKEADFVESLLRQGSDTGTIVQKILELGCGTGNYTRILLARGYHITGVDVSEDMLSLAKAKCQGRFLNADIRDLEIDDKYDACLAMFTVMGYLTENSDITMALRNVRRHLKPAGIFIFDVWNGLAVMRIGPEQRMKEVEDDRFRVTRYAVPTMRAVDHLCLVRYRVVVMDKEKRTTTQFEETHTIRFYFPQEIKQFLENCGFEAVRLFPFMDSEGVVDDKTWNIAVMARAAL